MKQLCIRKAITIGLVVISLPCTGQVNTEGWAYRDSLYRHIVEKGAAKHTCRFTYAQGSAAIDTGMGDNRKELSGLDGFIRQALNHPELYVCRIRLTGYSSIEDSCHLNEALARSRVESYYFHLRKHYPDLCNYPNDLAWVAEDWKGLSELVKASNLNEREEVLEIIRKVPGFDQREALLVKLNGGKPYLFLEKVILPQLRRVEMEIEYSMTPYVNPELEATVKEKEKEETGKDTGATKEPEPAQETPDSVVYPPSQETGKDSSVLQPSSHVEPRFAIKTNTLLWAGVQYNFKHTTPVANVALEYYINKNWSIEAGSMYSYWRYNTNHAFQGISGYRIEPRFRFSLPLKREQTEIFLGLYGRVGDYDIRKNNNTTNYTGDYWDAGLSAGTTIKLVGQLAMEIGVRGGYIKTRPIKYTMDGQYNWFEGRYKYYQVKITDLNVSVVYRFR